MAMAANAYNAMLRNRFRPRLCRQSSSSISAVSQAEILFCSLDRSAKEIGPQVNSNKTEFASIYQAGTIKSSSGHSLHCVGEFVYFESTIFSTKTDVNTPIRKALRDEDKLSVILKS